MSTMYLAGGIVSIHIQLALIALKLTEVIGWSWWIVLLPTILAIVMWIGNLIAYALIETREERRIKTLEKTFLEVLEK